jgi:hypothetical protein
MGYTPIDLEICNKFKTKYGLKLYEPEFDKNQTTKSPLKSAL